MLRGLDLSFEQFAELAAHARAIGIDFLSTAFDEASARFLATLGPRHVKSPSGEITNRAMMRCYGSFGLPVILSTGMATLGEVEQAIDWLEKAGAGPITVLHCVSQYPAAPEDANLRAMDTMASAFGLPVGWSDHTLGDIVTKVAGEHGLQPRCHPDLADKPVTLAEQANKSDMQFLRDLGRRYDSTASPKAGCLIFAPVDATTTATGKPLPSLTITRQSGDSVSYRRAARERAQDGAEADWQDQDAAERRQVHAGGERKRKLKRVYASKADATEAAKAETNRLKRAEATLSLTLAHGNAAIAPGLSVRAQGFKAEIDKKPWRIASANHEMDATGGFRTSLELDVAG